MGQPWHAAGSTAKVPAGPVARKKKKASLIIRVLHRFNGMWRTALTREHYVGAAGGPGNRVQARSTRQTHIGTVRPRVAVVGSGGTCETESNKVN